MQAIDLWIVGLYVLTTLAIGLLARRRAAKSLQAYFLADKSMPWYLLGLSNASDMFDISGTMWLVALCAIYGLKSMWIPWVWPVFNQIFLMVYLSTWLRRSNVLTGAEWIETRFGRDTGGQLSQFVVIAFAVLSVLGFLAYGFVGVGKFIEIFLPWSGVERFVPFEVAPQNVAHVYGIVFTTIVMIYAVLGGMFSIVWTDVVKFALMTVVSVIVGVIAIRRVDPATLTALTPAGWHTPFFGWTLDLGWTGELTPLNDKIKSDGFTLFGAVMMMMLFKGVLVSAAGPAPNYDMQKILSTRSPREAALMSGFVSVVLMPIRYLLVGGFAILAVAYFGKLGITAGGTTDYDRILPAAMLEFAPPGVLGLIVAGLLAAFVSTFSATLNAAPAYLVNDVYRRHINPQASRKRLIYLSYAVSVAFVYLSAAIGLTIPSINSLLIWIVSGLWGGYTAANVLKWYWWRFNGYGFFTGMLLGMIGALTLPRLLGPMFPEISADVFPLMSFPLLLLLSAAGCLVGTYLTPANDMRLLMDFYRRVRPWGFWGPVRAAVLREDPAFPVNRNFRRDMLNVVVGTVVQTVLVALPLYVVLRRFDGVAVCLAILAVGGVVLKKNWYDRLASD